MNIPFRLFKISRFISSQFFEILVYFTHKLLQKWHIRDTLFGLYNEIFLLMCSSILWGYFLFIICAAAQNTERQMYFATLLNDDERAIYFFLLQGLLKGGMILLFAFKKRGRDHQPGIEKGKSWFFVLCNFSLSTFLCSPYYCI